METKFLKVVFSNKDLECKGILKTDYYKIYLDKE